MTQKVGGKLSTRFSSELRLLAAAVVALVTGSVATAGPGLGASEITITADGVSPKSLVIRAASFRFFPVWTNLDAVAHTVTFDNGRCVITIAAGGRDWCEGRAADFSTYAGTYRYRVSDLVDPTGDIVVVPHERRVTMVASRAAARSGETVVLRGSVFATPVGPFGGVTPTPMVTLLRRLAGSQHFVAIREVRSKDCPQPFPNCDLNEAIWSTTIRPRATTTYVARIVDPSDQSVWERADSRRVVVRVIPSPK